MMSLRLSEREHELIKAQAAAQDMTMTAYMIGASLGTLQYTSNALERRIAQLEQIVASL